MSEQLRSSLSEVREDLDRVSQLVQLLTEKVRALELEAEESSFSFVSSPGTQPGAYPQRGSSSAVHQTTPSGGPIVSPAQSWSEREEIARQVGTFLRRAILGEIRGPSGRDRIKQASKIYIVCKDRRGQVFTHPVKLFTRWTDVKAICADSSGDFGDSVFVGLPSQREVKAALAGAGFSAPDAPDDQ